MKRKTATKTAVLFALSLSPMWVMAESDVKPLPFAQKPACADSETSVWCAGALPLPRKPACGDSETSIWCAGASDDRGIVEVRQPLGQDHESARHQYYVYGSEISR